LQEDEGKGIIWRLFSITRYAERYGGVYLGLEAIGLSRDIPASISGGTDSPPRFRERRSRHLLAKQKRQFA